VPFCICFVKLDVTVTHMPPYSPLRPIPTIIIYSCTVEAIPTLKHHLLCKNTQIEVVSRQRGVWSGRGRNTRQLAIKLGLYLIRMGRTGAILTVVVGIRRSLSFWGEVMVATAGVETPRLQFPNYT